MIAREIPDFGEPQVQPTREQGRKESFLPAATVQCHASNLLVLDNGDLVCAWFGGSQEGKGDISIFLSRMPSGSDIWTDAQRVTFDDQRSEQNPVLFASPSGELWLLYTSQKAGDQDSAVVKRVVSKDKGKTWSEPGVLFPEPGTFIRQPIQVLDNGNWVIPTFKCRTEEGRRWIGNDDVSAIRVSKDNGITWSEYPVPNSFGAVHMAIRRLGTGKYMAFYRSRWADSIYSSVSDDGIQWSPPKATELPNPNSGIAFDVLPSGRVVLVYNHSSKSNAQGERKGLYDEIAEEGDNRANQESKHGGLKAFWGAPRAPLNIAWSDDNGSSWTWKTLEDGDGYCMTNNSEEKLNRELSYPSIALSDDGMIHVAFTFWRQKIKYVQLKQDYLA